MKTKNRVLGGLAAVSIMAASSASAAVVTWTDWTNITATSATGVMGGVAVTAAITPNTGGLIDGPSQTACGTNWWTGTAYTNGTVSNAPTACEQVALNSPVDITVTFGSAIDSLYMALLSIGQSGVAITYDFSTGFSIDSEGDGAFGNDTTNGVLGAGTLGGGSLTMREFHGVVRFDNPVTSFRFTTSPDENWHAFSFGTATVPEPGSLALVGAALLGAGALSRRRKAA